MEVPAALEAVWRDGGVPAEERAAAVRAAANAACARFVR